MAPMVSPRESPREIRPTRLPQQSCSLYALLCSYFFESWGQRPRADTKRRATGVVEATARPSAPRCQTKRNWDFGTTPTSSNSAKMNLGSPDLNQKENASP